MINQIRHFFINIYSIYFSFPLCILILFVQFYNYILIYFITTNKPEFFIKNLNKINIHLYNLL